MSGATPDMFAPPPGEPPAGNEVVTDRFWLVVCTCANWQHDGHLFLTRSYKCVHGSEESAEREAVRLASLYQDYAFAVVQSKATVIFDRGRKVPVWSELQ